MKRRGFLALLGAAPVSAPVFAKEAAAKMGLAGLTAFASGGGEVPIGGGPASVSSEAASEIAWVKERLGNILSDEKRRERRRELRYTARQLDPDLASMRSISPAFAFNRQIDRCAEEHDKTELSYLQRRLKMLGGLLD